jgi:hypothetical protein
VTTNLEGEIGDSVDLKDDFDLKSEEENMCNININD